MSVRTTQLGWHPPSFQWQWFHDDDFEDYDDQVNTRIEAAYQQGRAFVIVRAGTHGSEPMEIIFNGMFQHDPATGNRCIVRRQGAESLLAHASRKLNEASNNLEHGNVRPRWSVFSSSPVTGRDALQDFAKTSSVSQRNCRYHKNGLCAQLARHTAFLACGSTFVVLNTLWLGIDANFNKSKSLYQADWVFIIVENIFCSYFLLELLIHFGAYRRKSDCLQDLWMLFDLSLVVLMVGEIWLLPMLMRIFNKGGGPGRGGWAVLRIARMLKIVRLGRLARIIRHCPELMTMVKAIMMAVRSVLFAMLLLGVLTYVFAIVLVTQLRDYDDVLRRIRDFRTMHGTMWILIIEGILLDGPKDSLKILVKYSYLNTSVFLVFIAISAFTIVNMLIGIICNVVDQVSQAEKEQAEVENLKAMLLEILECHDEDDDQHLRKDEFEQLLRSPLTSSILSKFGVDAVDLMSMKDNLFEDKAAYLSRLCGRISQRSGSSQGTNMRSSIREAERELSFVEFIEVVLRLREGNSATVSDVVDLRDFVKHQLHINREYIARRIGQLEQHLLDGISPSCLNSAGSTVANGTSRSVRFQSSHAGPREAAIAGTMLDARCVSVDGITGRTGVEKNSWSPDPGSSTTESFQATLSSSSPFLQKDLGTLPRNLMESVDVTWPAHCGCVEKRLTVRTMNANMKQIEYPLRGSMVIAADVQKRLNAGEEFSFKTLIPCSIGNPLAVGQKPLTFYRQVAACCMCPQFLQTMPADVVRRASAYLECAGGKCIGSYTNSDGLLLVRLQLASFIEERDGFPCDESHLCLTDGASEAVQRCIGVLLNDEMDGVLLPNPKHPLYSAAITAHGGQKALYNLNEERNWSVTKQELARAYRSAESRCVNVRALVVINPGNPSGAVMSRQDISMMIVFAKEKGIVILADEVYQANVYADDKQFFSFKRVLMEMIQTDAAYEEVQLISFHSASKGIMGECGQRGGYVEFVGISSSTRRQFAKVAATSLCSNIIGQFFCGLMADPPKLGEPSFPLFEQERTEIFENMRRGATQLFDGLNSIQGISCQRIDGAIYGFPRIDIPEQAIAKAAALGMAPDEYWCHRLLQQVGVVCLPGTCFGQQPDTYHFRVTILPEETMLADMIERLRNFQQTFIMEFVEGSSWSSV